MLTINILVAAYVAIEPYVLKQLLDVATPLLGQTGLAEACVLPAGLLIFLTVANNLAWRFNNYLNLKALPKLKADIIAAAADYVHGHSYRFFQNNLSGAISNKISDLANNTEELIRNIRNMVQTSLTIVIGIFVAFYVNPVFSLLFLLLTGLFIKAACYFTYKTEQYAKEFAESRSNAMGNVVDSLANAINVILFARKKYEQLFLRQSLQNMVLKDTTLQTKMMQYGLIMCSLTLTVQITAMLLLLYFGTKGTITIGDFALIFMLTIRILDYVWEFTQNLFNVAEYGGVFKQALTFIATAYDITDNKDAVPLQVTRGEIVFSNVNFSYQDSPLLFADKTVVITSHEKVGLVGYSGSGKSSFVNLITRTFDINHGDILIDNQSIKNVTLTSLRENISFIPQDLTLFHRSLIENIRYGKLDATDDEVIAAAKKAYVDEFAVNLPQGYATMVGERGVKLSGGQRQRIAIARAILKDAPILILDEATSQLDSVVEALIQQSLQHAMKNKTVIVIAHRLSTIKAMDRILVFKKGKILEVGSHDYLLQHGHIYQQLWQVQQGLYLS